MQSLKRAVRDLGLLGVLSIAIGLGMNAVRPHGSIKPTKNYFDKSATVKTPSGAGAKDSIPSPVNPGSGTGTPPTVTNVPIAPKEPQTARAETTKHPQHDYQEIDFAELLKVFRDPATARGLNLFVDARKPDLYEEGHIPGAMRCDPYEPDDALDGVVARANGVERVIVYCGGGDCEDSIFLCRELVEAGLPYDSIFLYPGGWREWSEKQMPAKAGHEEQ